MLGDDLEAWLAESALMKRTFRTCAIIAGLIERRFPGEEKIAAPDDDLDRPRLRRAAPAPGRSHRCCARRAHDAATGLLDIKRLGEMLCAHPGANRP